MLAQGDKNAGFVINLSVFGVNSGNVGGLQRISFALEINHLWDSPRTLRDFIASAIRAITFERLLDTDCTSDRFYETTFHFRSQ